MRTIGLLLLLAACTASGSSNGAPSAGAGTIGQRIDAEALVAGARILSADSMEGRRPGTPGSDRARRWIEAQYRQIGLQPIGGSFSHPFTVTSQRDSSSRQAVNFIGMVRGTESPDRYIVVTAHYDHVGIGRAVDGDSLYNGADDNASGASALLALARWFRQNPPRNSIIFAALDAEEMGLRGARDFVADPPVPKDAIVLNVNMDMVGRNDRNELYAAGTFHYPFLKPYVERVVQRAPITLKLGHDTPEVPRDDWTSQSDHGAFHSAGIPFLYFGVEDHPDYHRPSDEFARLQPEFYAKAVETVLDAILEIDRNMDAIQAARR